MRFRRFLKRAVKPFVMVGIVGTLSVSLIASTPSNAQALVIAPVLPAVYGATTLAMPSLLATSLALHPVGWGIAGAAALTMGLYATKDYWLPYVTGDFGKGNADTATVPSGAAYPDPKMKVSFPRLSPDSRTLVVDVNNSNPSGFTTVTVAFTVHCKPDNGGPTQIFKNFLQYKNFATPFAGPANVSKCQWSTGGVTQLGTVIYGHVGLANSGDLPLLPADGSIHPRGPSNSVIWGQGLEPDFNPRSSDVAYRVESECIAPDGKIATATAHSLGSEGGIKFPSCEAAGLGHGTGAVKVFTAAPGFTPDEVLWEVKRPAEDPDHPLCSPTRPTSGCKLGVTLDGKPCVMGDPVCENWSAVRNDPNYSTRLSCQFGPYQVSMEKCNPLERAYEPGGAPATEPNTDGNPGTRSDAQPDGSTQPKPSSDPNVSTPVIPGGAAAGPGPNATTQQAECFPTGWAMLNPIEWVMKPVGCALEAAFKPKKDLQTRLAGMQGQFSNKVPVSWFGVGVDGVSGGSCPTSWAVEFDGKSYSLICGTEADNIIRGFRPVLGSMLIMAMLWPFVRSLFYAAIPVFKVTPS